MPREGAAAVLERACVSLAVAVFFGGEAEKEEEAEEAEAEAEAGPAVAAEKEKAGEAGGAEAVEAARRWLHSRMVSRWRSVSARYARPMRKLRRFCALGEAAAARGRIASAHWPADAAAGERVARAAAALRALAHVGGDVLETPNLVEQAALDVLGDARTAGSFLTHCFA
ncbi:hypothetical protein EMIHUDRAFT_436128 [Emiliania huxleyi CCMP1516]|uniref:Uncharacterized protein n=2 Tax=Emiliania huxleyi TaxID=2903 RepID=A0A0D3J5G9_EMIH1|nr:hypothetical protein EMIHUDRAFT_446346 [Emiliania huxleyi CCMP1516]XP_005771183.1 hypothetical protein EMIHUDRAFT_436128 [Emiliania huxleyi CCMP1516]EOD08464.1 hypothetical protein EMIHUDRAFT_446346 [Emiliania huxleyi CCMP1516]EOD18754.1 hypothetical protein EMIHUDRAFT_436128 [Emiliania huxleyi CCMP1516]|eukprot:XP_005760893.1 hypothetical protein EMIHUDRAFT_446346 [Emiliania huxleyi CCMP1516]